MSDLDRTGDWMFLHGPRIQCFESCNPTIGTNELRRINNEITPDGMMDKVSLEKHIETYCKQYAPILSGMMI